jgi:hypothetical protein
MNCVKVRSRYPEKEEKTRKDQKKKKKEERGYFSTISDVVTNL